MNAVAITRYASAFDIIKQRRSIGQFTKDQPTHAQIERLLEAATSLRSRAVALFRADRSGSRKTR